MEGVTHVLHLATVKETPEQIMDVAVKGLFWLLEACRTSKIFKQFIMVGGDAADAAQGAVEVAGLRPRARAVDVDQQRRQEAVFVQRIQELLDDLGDLALDHLLNGT